MLICLEAQAVTTADLGQKHGILARLQFSLILRLIDLTVDQCSSSMLNRHVLYQSVHTAAAAAAAATATTTTTPQLA